LLFASTIRSGTLCWIGLSPVSIDAPELALLALFGTDVVDHLMSTGVENNWKPEHS
jgi:hypothetical protein